MPKTEIDFSKVGQVMACSIDIFASDVTDAAKSKDYPIFTLPANSAILRTHVNVSEAFNDTGPIITVGTSVTTDALCADGDVDETSATIQTVNKPLLVTEDTVIQANLTITSEHADPRTGKATVILEVVRLQP